MLQSFFIVPGPLERSMDEWGIKKRATYSKRTPIPGTTSNDNANVTSPTNEPTVHALSFSDQSLAEDFYFALDPPNEKMSAPLTEATPETATDDTGLLANEYGGTPDNCERDVSETLAATTTEGCRTVAESATAARCCNTTSRCLLDNLSKRFSTYTSEPGAGNKPNTNNHPQHTIITAQGTEDNKIDLHTRVRRTMTVLRGATMMTIQAK